MLVMFLICSLPLWISWYKLIKSYCYLFCRFSSSSHYQIVFKQRDTKVCSNTAAKTNFCIKPKKFQKYGEDFPLFFFCFKAAKTILFQFGLFENIFSTGLFFKLLFQPFLSPSEKLWPAIDWGERRYSQCRFLRCTLSTTPSVESQIWKLQYLMHQTFA